MSNVPARLPGSLSRLESRAMSKELAQLDARGQFQLAQIEQAADLQVARVQAVTYVAKQGLQGVAMVSQTEQNLAQLVPLATGRLQAIGDAAALSIAEIVADTPRQVAPRRCR